MRRRTLLSASLGLGSLAGWAYVGGLHGATSVLSSFSDSGAAFGTTVTIQVLHHDPVVAQSAIADALAQVRQVDALMSLHQESSQVLRIHGRVVGLYACESASRFHQASLVLVHGFSGLGWRSPGNAGKLARGNNR